MWSNQGYCSSLFEMHSEKILPGEGGGVCQKELFPKRNIQIATQSSLFLNIIPQVAARYATTRATACIGCKQELKSKYIHTFYLISVPQERQSISNPHLSGHSTAHQTVHGKTRPCLQAD